MKCALSGKRRGVFDVQKAALQGSGEPWQLRGVGYCEGQLELDWARWKAVL